MTQEQKDAMDAKWQEMQNKNLPTPKPPPRPIMIQDDFGPNYGPHPQAPIPQTGGHTPPPYVGHGTISHGPGNLTIGGVPVPTGGPFPPVRPRPYPMSPIYPPPNPYGYGRPTPMGIGSLFNQLAYMPQEQFDRNLGRYQRFNEQYGGMLGPNMGRRDRFNLFNQLGGMSDEQFGMGMDRLSQYQGMFGPPAISQPPMTGGPRPNPYAGGGVDMMEQQAANPYSSPSYTGSFGRGLYGAGMGGRDLMGGGMGMGYGAFGGGGYYRPSAPSGMGGKGGARSEPQFNAYSGGSGKGGSGGYDSSGINPGGMYG